MINLENDQYKVYDTEYKNQVITARSNEGIFYVPGDVTKDMQPLYETDSFAKENQIVGIKLKVENGEISVVYQESPKDICQLQGPSDSALEPIVCLPNELVINVYTNLDENQFTPDSILE